MTNPISQEARLDRLANRMTGVATELAFMVRTQDSTAVGEWLNAHLAGMDGQELMALLVILAAMVDVDRTKQELLGWCEDAGWLTWADGDPDGGRKDRHPCGTTGAYWRHCRDNSARRKAGLPELPLDDACLDVASELALARLEREAAA